MPSNPATAPYLRRYALCVAALSVSLVLFPLLALVPVAVPLPMPRWLANALFFWPQFLLLPMGVTTTEPGAGAPVYGPGVLPYLAALFWLAVLAGFARLTLHWRKRWLLLALFVGVALLAELLMLGLRAAGLTPVLDGP